MNANYVFQRFVRASYPMRYGLISLQVALLLCFALIFAKPADGQVFSSAVSGYVKDAKGAPVEEAHAAIVNTATRQMREAVTDVKGYYSFQQLMPGTYELTVKVEGMNSYVIHGLTLGANQNSEYSVKLQTLDASKKTNVGAGNVTYETQTPKQSMSLRSEEIAELPTSLRNPLLVVHDTAGVTAITTGATPANTADQYSSRFGVDGGRQNGSAILVDGVPMTSLGRGDVLATPGFEAVREVQVVHAADDAAYGLSAGSAINLITKSGANVFHGSGFEFMRNDEFDANRWENNKYRVDRQPFRRNQYGGDIGGPVGKDPRLYFFAGFEALKQSESSTEVATVPTVAMKKGDFSKATASGGTLIPIYNPFTTNLVSGANYTRQIFAGNVIPAHYLNSAGLLTAKLYPNPNAPGTAGSNGQYIASSNVDTENNREDGRLDWAPVDSLSFFLRGTRARQTASVPTYFGNGADQTSGQREPRVEMAAGGTWAPNARWAYNFLFGGGVWHDTQTTASQNYNGVAIGLPAVTVAQFQANTMPQFSISNYQGLGDAENKANISKNYHGEINASRQYLQHSLKFGFAYQLSRWDPSDAYSALFNFTNGLTSGPTALVDTSTSGNAIASLLLGAGASGNAPYNPPLQISQKTWAVYVHDTWHFNSRLTVSVGLHYEAQGAPTESGDRFNNFDPLGSNPLSSTTGLTLKGGLVYNQKGLWKADRNDVAPRLGIAYKLSDSVVFRTGYGISYVPTSLSGLAASDGYSANTVWTSTLGNAGFVPRYLLNNPFPNNLNTPVGSNSGMSTNVGSSINANLATHNTSYVGNYTADLEFQVGQNGVLDVGYESVQGRKLAEGVATNINQLDPTYLANGPELNRLVTNPFAKVITTGPLSGSTIAAYQLLLPFEQFTSIFQSPLSPEASSGFNALLLKYHYKLSKNANVMVTYQWSKSIDNASESDGSEINDAVRNTFNLNGERSLSAHDVPKDLAVNFVYMLPFGREKGSGVVDKFKNSLISGWQIASVLRLASGLPLQFYAPNNLSTYGFAVQRPTITSLSKLKSTTTSQSPDHWFSTLYVNAPQAYTVGDMPRYVGNVRTGGTSNIDLSLSRSFNIYERLRLQIRAEAFNAANTPQYGRANTTLGSAGFGTVTSTINNPRNIQLGARLDF
ncbi:MAG: TonB-dependent receptor [Bryobacteraceae bacterium]|nr:TonB-dependent receptor [Bryobacteraceae bacterium]